jgi:hypothetical protein
MSRTNVQLRTVRWGLVVTAVNYYSAGFGRHCDQLEIFLTRVAITTGFEELSAGAQSFLSGLLLPGGHGCYDQAAEAARAAYEKSCALHTFPTIIAKLTEVDGFPLFQQEFDGKTYLSIFKEYTADVINQTNKINTYIRWLAGKNPEIKKREEQYIIREAVFSKGVYDEYARVLFPGKDEVHTKKGGGR